MSKIRKPFFLIFFLFIFSCNTVYVFDFVLQIWQGFYVDSGSGIIISIFMKESTCKKKGEIVKLNFPGLNQVWISTPNTPQELNWEFVSLQLPII